jgi:hypothetical protein
MVVASLYERYGFGTAIYVLAGLVLSALPLLAFTDLPDEAAVTAGMTTPSTSSDGSTVAIAGSDSTSCSYQSV